MNSNNKSRLNTYIKNVLKSQLNGPIVDLTEAEDAEYHPSKDIVFLERLDADAITDEERAELLEHLDKCVFCRQEMQRLCECEALFAINRDENPPITQTSSDWERPAAKKAVKQWSLIGGVLLLLIGFVALYPLPSGNQGQIAHNDIQNMLNENERNFSTLLADSYRLDGTLAIKGDIPVMDDHKREVLAAYQKLLADYPDEIDFRIAFAKYLLFVLQEPAQARDELEKALEKSLMPSELDRVPELHLLLGIAAFKEGNDTLAKQHYQNVLDLEPKNMDAKANMAISLYRNGETEKALEILRELRSENIPVTLRNKIDVFFEN